MLKQRWIRDYSQSLRQASEHWNRIDIPCHCFHWNGIDMSCTSSVLMMHFELDRTAILPKNNKVDVGAKHKVPKESQFHERCTMRKNLIPRRLWFNQHTNDNRKCGQEKKKSQSLQFRVLMSHIQPTSNDSFSPPLMTQICPTSQIWLSSIESDSADL